MSHPVRVRGLKSLKIYLYVVRSFVAPRAGAWIEIKELSVLSFNLAVAPRAGAWIEIKPC